MLLHTRSFVRYDRYDTNEVEGSRRGRAKAQTKCEDSGHYLKSRSSCPALVKCYVISKDLPQGIHLERIIYNV